MGFKQHISRTWQMIEQQVNDVPFRPDHEAAGRGQEAGNGRGQARRDRARSASSGGEDRLLQRGDRAVVCGFRGL